MDAAPLNRGMAYALVPTGRFFGWTADRIRERLAACDQALEETPPGGAPPVSVTVNGKSFTFALGGRSIDSEKSDLVAALALVDDTVVTPTNRARARGNSFPWLPDLTVLPSSPPAPSDNGTVIAPSPKLLFGIGNPNGSVAAPVGSQYTDVTDPTNPVVYIKAGGGNTSTGWV
jgi:hypothetical protein